VTPAEFARRLGYYRQGGLQARNLYLWLAGADALRAVLSDVPTTWTAVPMLLPSAAADETAVRRGLDAALRAHLEAHAGRRGVVVLAEPALLARYRVPLTLCYEYVDGGLMGVLVADRPDVSRFTAPRGLRLEMGRVIDYLRAAVDVDCVIEEAAV
jgi:hypothetical protein